MRLIPLALTALLLAPCRAEDGAKTMLERAKSTAPVAPASASPAGSAPARRYSFPADKVEIFNSQNPTKPPYCAVYRDGNKSVVFLAAEHANKEQQDSFESVRHVLGAKPQLVIIEMTDAQAHDKSFVDQYAGEAEPHFTAQLADALKIPVQGGEFVPADELAAATRGEFSVKDYEGFYIVRTLLNDRRGEKIATIVDEFKQEFGVKDPAELFSEPEFRDWYREKNGRDFSREQLEKSDTWPAKDATLFTRRVAAASCQARDARLGGLIADALGKYDRVAVVYGAGHQSELSRALEAMLGKPVIGPCAP
jgi:hypothetical protein